MQKNTEEEWLVTFEGPEQSPFENAMFTVLLNLKNFPYKAPSVIFKTPVYHPNVDPTGKICEDMIESGSNWDPKKRLSIVLEKVKSVMMVPSESNNSNASAF